jgi:hypothetical protein
MSSGDNNSVVEYRMRVMAAISSKYGCNETGIDRNHNSSGLQYKCRSSEEHFIERTRDLSTVMQFVLVTQVH